MQADQTIEFRMHGLKGEEDVPVDVFAARLSALVSALRAADRAVNGDVTHEYRIAKLSSSAPTAQIYEATKPSYSPQQSAIAALEECTTLTIAGDREGALRFGQCPKGLRKLAAGAGKSYSHVEISVSRDSIIRVDPFLKERASAIVSGEAPRTTEDQQWYKGVVAGSFDGRIEEVDLRGALPEIKLILSAGRKEIDCVCRFDDIEEIRDALDRRVRLNGNAIYDGKSGLPRRIHVSKIERVEGGDFTQWKGAFRQFDVPDWSEDDA